MADGKTQGLERALESFGHAIVALDSQRRVIFASRGAQELARRADGLRIENGKLVAEMPDENQKLQAALNFAIAPRVIHLRRKSSTALHVAVVPYRSGHSNEDKRLPVIVFLAETNSSIPSRCAVLRDLFQLTPTEIRIADKLIEGGALAQISAQLGLTFETTRFYIKRILSKTGTSRQRDLVRLVISLPSI